MNIKTWITDLKQATMATESFKNISMTFKGVGLNSVIDDITVAKYATSIKGLTVEQAKLALSTTQLSAHEKELVLTKAGLISETKALTATQIVETAQKELGNKTDAKSLLVSAGIITNKELEENATIQVTWAKLEEAVANGLLTTEQSKLLASIFGVTGANYGETVSFELLTKAIWDNIAAIAKWLVTNPVGWAILAGGALFGVVKITDALTESTEEAAEAAKDAKQEYENSLSQIETLNTKIEENNRLIQESEESASYDGYRKRLEAENAELERQIELEKIKAQEQKTEADKKARKVLTDEEYKYNKHNEVNATGFGYTTKWSKGDILDATGWYLKQAETTGKVDNKLKEYIEIIQEQRDYLDTSNSQSKELYDQLGLLIDRYIALYDAKTKTETGVADNSIQDTASKLAEFNEQFSKQFEEKSKPTLENISKIEEAMQAISDGENVDFDTMWEINELDTEGIISSIDEVNGAYKMSIDELIALKDSWANGETEYWEAQKQDAQNAIQEIKKLKVVAEARLNAKKLEIGFIDSASEAEMLAEELEEIASYNSQIAEYENIIKDCNLGITEFNRHLGDTIDYTKTIESLTEQADELLEAQENAIDDIIDSLNAEEDILESQKDALDSQLEVLEEQQEAIETIIDNYEQVADIASDAIQDEIDTLEENKQSIEDYYDEMIKKLQDANDERQEAIDLAEKQAALENAKKNKVRTFDSARGWIFEVDKEAYDIAENDLLNAQTEVEISRLEKEKERALEGYNAQIEAFEEYAEKWKDVSDGTTEAEEEALASQILGADWREKIKEQDIDILHNYQSQFNNYKTQLHNLTNGEIADLKRSIEAKQKEIDAKEKQIESWNNYKTEIQKAASDMQTTWNEYIGVIDEIKLNENSNYQDRLANFEEFRNKYQSISNDIIKLNKKMAESETNTTPTPSVGQGGMLAGFMGISNALNTTFNNSFFDIFKEISSLFDRIGAMFSGEGYSSGGTNQTTGLAMLHGTKSSSETIFNATDSKKLYDLVHNTSNLSSMLAGKIVDSLNVNNKTLADNKNARIVNNNNNYDFTFGNIVSDNPQNFMKFLQDYFRKLSSESNVF